MCNELINKEKKKWEWRVTKKKNYHILKHLSQTAEKKEKAGKFMSEKFGFFSFLFFTDSKI